MVSLKGGAGFQNVPIYAAQLQSDQMIKEAARDVEKEG
jgi:hypothetical protein